MSELEVPPKRLSGAEPFRLGGESLPFSVLDFWRWASSDLVSNALRGVLAEYLVARALNCADGVRVEWDACDLRTASGLRIEVKASGYVQSWAQDAESRPRFRISATRGWDAASNTYRRTPGRSADVYVFAVHAHRTREAIDPMDVGQWEFYVVATAVLDKQCKDQKTIGLAKVRKLSGGAVEFEGLAQAVRQASESRSNQRMEPPAASTPAL